MMEFSYKGAKYQASGGVEGQELRLEQHVYGRGWQAVKDPDRGLRIAAMRLLASRKSE